MTPNSSINTVIIHCCAAVISLQPGAGQTVVQALVSTLDCETVRLWVASANTRAIRLYERMGFVTVGELSRWYHIT